MRRISNFWLALVLLLLCVRVSTPLGNAQEIDARRPTDDPVALRWLGTAGWEIQVGRTIILIDPFLTRKEPDRIGGKWKSDEEAVLKAIKRADYIFAGHSHADHIADIPFIAKKFGSKVMGSRTTVNIALTAGVDKSQLVTIRGGENLDFKEFSVQVIESVHGVLTRNGRRRQPAFEEVTKPWSGPVLGTSFVVGDCFLYLFTFGNRKILHQSTGGFIADKAAGVRADVALLYPMDRSDTEGILKVLQPKTVFVNHFDEWRVPFPDGLPERSLARARRFTRAVVAIDAGIQVITPSYFKPYPIP